MFSAYSKSIYRNHARKRHININFFVRLVLGRPRVCPGDFTGFVPGTNSVKTCHKPGFPPYFAQWKPGKPRFVPGTSPGVSLGQTRSRSAAQKVYMKKAYVPFSLAKEGKASTTVAPLLSCSVARRQGHRGRKKLWCTPCPWENGYGAYPFPWKNTEKGHTP